jgi:hypothetical protein
MAQLCIQIYGPGFAIFGITLRTDRDMTLIEIHVTPANSQRFGFTRPAVLQETDVVAELNAVLKWCSVLVGFNQSAFNESWRHGRFTKPIDLIGGIKPVRFLFRLEPFQPLGGTGFQMAINAGGLQDVSQTNKGKIARPGRLAGTPQPVEMGGNVVRAQLIEPQLADCLDPAVNVSALSYERVWFLAAGEQPIQIGLRVVLEHWGKADGAKPVFVALGQKFPKLGEGFCLGRGGFEGNPFFVFTPDIVFDSDPRQEASVAAPQAANRILAIVQNLGVCVAA